MSAATSLDTRRPIFTDREAARSALTAKVASQRGELAADAAWRLRWIDCAPAGANHLLAPLQDKRGVPMGGVYHENLGPSQALREARARRGLHPLTGRRSEVSA